jgi:hypothetical protein
MDAQQLEDKLIKYKILQINKKYKQIKVLSLKNRI